MGIKDLFSEKTNSVIVSTSLEEEAVKNVPELESAENVKEHRKKIERFIPLVDFRDPNNFARYGSAEAYYKDAITRIYNQFPYDGSEREMQQFLNESNDIDLYMFNNLYPRTTGYAIMSADGWGTKSATAGAGTKAVGTVTINVSSDPQWLQTTADTIQIITTDGTTVTATAHDTTTTTTDTNSPTFEVNATPQTTATNIASCLNANSKLEASSDGLVITITQAAAGAAGNTTITGTDNDPAPPGSFSSIVSFTGGTDAVDWTLPSSTEYIKVMGGPHTASGGMASGSLATQFTGANIYNTDIYGFDGVHPLDRTGTRESNLRFDLSKGVTTELWFRKGDWITSLTEKEVIFDLWNGEPSSSAGYGRLLLFVTGAGVATTGQDPFRAHLASGSNVWDMSFGGSTVTTASLTNTWNHVAFTFLSSSTSKELQSKFYYNGYLQEQTGTAHMATFGEVTGSLIGYIGALQTSPSGNNFHGSSMAGYGKLSGSLDEFRYWKTKRTERDIQRNWWTQVRGGTNTDVSNADLGVYYKFNEGITGTSSVESTVLDYSGRISNGNWIGYPSNNARNTGSAIVSASAAGSEFADPIIYSHHPDVVSLYNDLIDSGSVHDNENISSILDSLPSWLVEDDDANGSGDLKKLTQIIGSYFDTLHLQVQGLTQIKTATYHTASHMKPVPFSDRLLSSKGLFAPETFVDAGILERFANRKDNKEYSTDINDVKNHIYQNIYNNLVYIYKSKGTEKAFRNLIHCYGISDEVLKFNAYGNNTTFKFEDTHYETTIRKNYIDFNHPTRFAGTVYQNSSSVVHAGQVETAEVTYVSGTYKDFANTAEIEVIFPRKFEFSNPQHFDTTFLTSSIFGYHTASVSSTVFEWPVEGEDHNFQLYAIRTATGSSDAYFRLKSRPAGFDLTSSTYSNVYDNQKWNFAVRFKDKFWPYVAGVSGSGLNNDIIVEFVGVNSEYGVIKNQFALSASGLADEFLTGHRRYYAGADRTDFTGSTVTQTDVKISSVRHWASYLSDDVIKAHAMDPENVGVLHANRNALFIPDTSFNIENRNFPEIETLALHWDFSQITGSDTNGEFTVADASSGSVTLQSRYPNDGNISHIVANQYAGTGYFPYATSSTKVVDKNYVPAAKQRLPEVVNSADAVKVLTQDDDLFPSDPAVSQTFFAFEKSMYGVVSQEMINMFGTIVEFNNLIGEVVYKYREGYKDLDKLRLLFFEKIQNDPDLDKFIDYFKWIDSSLSAMIQQLLPASANVADEIRTVVESHILERSSYRHQYPMLDYKGNERWGADDSGGGTTLEAGVFGIRELLYDWKHGHAPLIPPFENNKSIAFNGVNNQSLLTVSDAADLSFGADGTTGNEPSFSITAWVKPTQDLGVSDPAFGIVSKVNVADEDGHEYHLAHVPGAGLTFLLADGWDGSTSGPYIAQGLAGALTKDAWQQVVATYDGSRGTAGMKVYINGVAQSTVPVTKGSYVAMHNGGDDLVIGRRFTGATTNVATGFIDEVALFSKELSAAEVTELYNGHKTFDLKTHSAAANIVSWWRMGDKATGTSPNYTIPDQVGSNNATMTNFQGNSTSEVSADAPPSSPSLSTDYPAARHQASHGLWWKERAERDHATIGTSATIDSARKSINDIILSFNSASVDKNKLAASDGTRYAGSAYPLRQLTRTYKLTIDYKGSPDRVVHGGYNYPRNQKPDFLANVIKAGDATTLRIATGSFRDIDIEEAGPPSVQTKRRFEQTTVNNSAATDDYSGDGKGEIYSPVVQYSSSMQGGYTKHRDLDSVATVTAQVEFAGYHVDAYGPDYESPMQGPFTYEHVGGKQHRHIAHTVDPALTSSANRPEAWKVVGGDTFTTRSNMHHPPAYANYHRDGLAKRPLNIKNLQYTSASSVLGNYNKVYEIVQTSDRNTNNSAFVKSEGFATAALASAFFETIVDYAKPVRRKTQHVFVERFSAPGGPDTAGDADGGPFLDYESAQYSPYNNINYRNDTVRAPLRTLLKERSEQFGLRSGSANSELHYIGSGGVEGTASYHKVNRNPLKKLIYTNNETGDAGIVGTSSAYDNYYVQHMIPRSDYQYSWITASYISSVTDVLGYFPYDGLVQTGSALSSGGLVSAINFVSASDFGAGLTAGSRRSDNEDDTYDAGSLVRTDFAGLNTTIIEPISASDFTLGYPLTADVYNYYNYGDIGSFALDTVNMGSFIQRIGAPPSDKRPHILPNLIHHRNGPYGHPTWKQIRVGQGALGRYYRKNNLYTHTPLGGVEKTVITPTGTRTVRDKYAASLIVSQSVVTSRCRPITQELLVNTGERQGRRATKAVVVRSSYANNIMYFDDNEFARKLDIKVDSGFSAYDQVRKMYEEGALNSSNSPVVGVLRVMYSEVIYPAVRNAYTNKVRGRTSYQNNFWRDSRTDRETLASTKKPTNSMGITMNQSAWCLDADVNFAANSEITGGIDGNNSANFRPGELQNHNVQFHSGSDKFLNQPDNQEGGAGYIRGGPIYARRHIMTTTASVNAPWGMTITEVAENSTHTYALHPQSLFRGQAKWEAAEQAGRYEGTSSTFVTSAVNPFYDTYDKYFSELKGKAQNMSIMPEFRISEHLDFYRNNDNNFLAENVKMLSIAGTPTASAIPQNSNEKGFFKIFSNSDFMKYFEVIKEDHKGTLKPFTIKLKCKGLKKFIPYDGFYPAERTLEMVTQFSKSYASHIKYEGTDVSITNTNAPRGAFRAFLKPLFAPGILYNTIKAGLAVDYPILTGSHKANATIKFGTFNTAVKQKIFSGSFAIMGNSTSASFLGGANAESINYHNDAKWHGDGWDKRIPFEALVDPERFLSYVNITDDEPSRLCSQDVTASWTGIGNKAYKHMMHNFLAESMNFFLSNGKPTTITSKPQDQWLSVSPGQPYGMRIKMFRSMDSVRLTSGSWGNFPLPQDSRLFGAGDPRIASAGDLGRVFGPAAANQDISPKETFTMYSRPSAFGPPLGYMHGATASVGAPGWAATGSMFEFSSENGVYCSHTPPYYDGEAWIDLIFWPKGLESESGSLGSNKAHTFGISGERSGLWEGLGQNQGYGASPFQPTLEEVFASPSPEVFKSDQDGVPLAGTFVRKWRFDQEELTRGTLEGTVDKTICSYHSQGLNMRGPAAGPWINEWAMQGDASLNIFEKQGDRWAIQTKYETPMLNFNHVTASGAGSTLTLKTDTNANSTIPRGMWHQFGRLPQNEEGVFLQVTDIPSTWLANHPSASLVWDVGGIIDARNRSPRLPPTRAAALAASKNKYNKYAVPIQNKEGDVKIPSMGSLIDVCGFSTDPARIGELRKKKTIKECIVAVPFKIEEGERKFYILPAAGDLTYGPSITEQINKMQSYVFPPAFDFITNPDVPRVAMYIFEFNHEFDKDDLSHMWQNLPPKLGRKAEESSAIVTHDLLTNELMGDWEEVIASADKANFRSGLDSEVRWMVFKVKQRAKSNYYEAIVGGGAEAQAADIPDYTYNWPYDFCSIVELAQIESEIEFGNDDISPKEGKMGKFSADAADWKGGSLSSVVGGGAGAGAASTYVDPSIGMAAARAASAQESFDKSKEAGLRMEQWKAFKNSDSHPLYRDALYNSIKNSPERYGSYDNATNDVYRALRNQLVGKAEAAWVNTGAIPVVDGKAFGQNQLTLGRSY
jgi:hypothetical protein